MGRPEGSPYRDNPGDRTLLDGSAPARPRLPRKRIPHRDRLHERREPAFRAHSGEVTESGEMPVGIDSNAGALASVVAEQASGLSRLATHCARTASRSGVGCQPVPCAIPSARIAPWCGF